MPKPQVNFSQSTHFSKNHPIIETANYSDDDLLNIYEKRIQEYCHYFNSAILPSLIDQFAVDIKNSTTSEYQHLGNLCQSVIKASDTKHYQHFHINTNVFSFFEEYSINVMGSFLNFHIEDNTPPDFHDIKGLHHYFTQHDAPPIFFVNMLMMRFDIYHYLTEVAGHEFSHAIVYFYYEMIRDGCYQEIGKDIKDIDLHGHEWSTIATLLGVSTLASHDAPAFNLEDYKGLHYCYTQKDYRDMGIYPLSAIGDNLYICHNGHMHDVSDSVSLDIQKGVKYRCTHCHETIIPFNADML